MRKPRTTRQRSLSSAALLQNLFFSPVLNVKRPISRSPAGCRWVFQISTKRKNIGQIIWSTRSFSSTSDWNTGNPQVQWKCFPAMSVTSFTTRMPVWSSTLDKSIRRGTLDDCPATSHVQTVEKYIPTWRACGNIQKVYMEYNRKSLVKTVLTGIQKYKGTLIWWN